MKLDEIQEGGDHYLNMEIQPWQVMESIMSADEFRGFLWGNVIKYAMRWQKKGGVDDLKKLIHYSKKLVDVIEKAEK